MLAVYAYFTIFKKFPRWVLLLLGVIPLPSVMASKGPQIMLNIRQRHTGELSPISVGLQAFGNLARTIVASVSSKPDLLILTTHTLAFSLASILLGQILYYKSNTANALAKRDHNTPMTLRVAPATVTTRRERQNVGNRKRHVGLVKNRLKE